MASSLLQSLFRVTTIGRPGSQGGKGSVTPQASATSLGSTTQLASQLGCPLPSRSPNSGGVHGSSHDGELPGSSTWLHMLSVHGGTLLKTSKNDLVPHTWFPTTWPGAANRPPSEWKYPQPPYFWIVGPQSTPTLQPGGSVNMLCTRAIRIPSTM